MTLFVMIFPVMIRLAAVYAATRLFAAIVGGKRLAASISGVVAGDIVAMKIVAIHVIAGKIA
jgi:hypothetical protein